MKNFLFLLFFLSAGVSAYSQTEVVPNQSNELLNKPEKRDPLYCCSKCNYTSPLPGKCAVDKTPLIKEGTYYCPVCYTTNDKPCKCPKCGKSMKKMETAMKEASTGEKTGVKP
ncbi:MAG TPA: hypothetical protein VGO45_06780 [Bacteroidia bacterium]|jgi:rubrerythrin|nr:hypothetical protein [Bacteroidia bacterium]